MRVLLTGGGTGGHIYPAIAIAEALLAEAEAMPLELLFVGARDRLEAQLVPQARLRIAFVAGRPLARRLSLEFVRTIASNLVGIVQSLAILLRFRPHCVVATGGYVAFPVVVAARIARSFRLMRARIGMLEINAVSGLTNRLLVPLVDETWLALGQPGAAAGRRRRVTGTPVRKSFTNSLPKGEARAMLGLDPAALTVVVMGGSQGAQSLNRAVVEFTTAYELPLGWQIVLVCGTRDYPAVAETQRLARSRDRIRLIAYLDDPRAAYAAADLFVTRSGASTLAELAATGTPAILVPYPHATGNHQLANAEVFRAAGAARIVPDAELDGQRLFVEITAALQAENLTAMQAAARSLASADAGPRIARRIIELVRG